MQKYKLFSIIISIFCLITITFYTQFLFAQKTEEEPHYGFDKNIIYNIYYEVSTFEVDAVRRVIIVGIVTVKGKDFLEIETADSYRNRKNVGITGYILFSTIRSILPSGFIEPERTYPKESSNRIIIPRRRKEGQN